MDNRVIGQHSECADAGLDMEDAMITEQEYHAMLNETIAKLKQKHDELAAQVEVMQDALAAVYGLVGHATPAKVQDEARIALSITPSAALAEIQARTLEELATKWLPNMKLCDNITSVFQTAQNSGVDDCIRHTFNMAVDIRNGE